MSLKETNVLIGTIGFWRGTPEHFRSEIGYVMLPAFHSKGLMQEAIAAAIDYAWSSMGLHSIEAQVNPDNQASIRLLERNGFVREGYYRENYFYAGKFMDTGVYSLIKA